MMKGKYQFKRKWILIVSFFGLSLVEATVNAQVGIGTTMPNSSAQLEVVASDKGVLIPKVSLTSTTDVSTISNGNVVSLLVYNTSNIGDVIPGFYYWDGIKWSKIVDVSDSFFNETVTNLVDNNNGTISYTNEQGSIQTFNLDNSSTNEIQTLSLTGNILSLSNSGGSVNLPSGADGDAWGVNNEDQSSSIFRSGNVGIGTASPSNSLHVNGSVRFEGLTTGTSNDNLLVANSTGVVKLMSTYEMLNNSPLNVITVTTNYSATVNDDIIIYNGFTGGDILVLPTTGVPVGKKLYIVNIGTQDFNFDPAPINGGIVTAMAQVGTTMIYTGAGHWATLIGY